MALCPGLELRDEARQHATTARHGRAWRQGCKVYKPANMSTTKRRQPPRNMAENRSNKVFRVWYARSVENLNNPKTYQAAREPKTSFFTHKCYRFLRLFRRRALSTIRLSFSTCPLQIHVPLPGPWCSIKANVRPSAWYTKGPNPLSPSNVAPPACSLWNALLAASVTSLGSL